MIVQLACRMIVTGMKVSFAIGKVLENWNGSQSWSYVVQQDDHNTSDGKLRTKRVTSLEVGKSRVHVQQRSRIAN